VKLHKLLAIFVLLLAHTVHSYVNAVLALTEGEKLLNLRDN